MAIAFDKQVFLGERSRTRTVEVLVAAASVVNPDAAEIFCIRVSVHWLELLLCCREAETFFVFPLFHCWNSCS